MPGHFILYCSASAAVYAGLVGGALLVDAGSKYFHKVLKSNKIKKTHFFQVFIQTAEDEEFIKLRQKLVEELMHQLKSVHDLHAGNSSGKKHQLHDEDKDDSKKKKIRLLR